MTAPFSLEKSEGFFLTELFSRTPGVWGWKTPKDTEMKVITYNRRKT